MLSLAESDVEKCQILFLLLNGVSVLKRKDIMNITKYGRHFSESKFVTKLLKLAKRAGKKLLYPAMLLYKIYESKNVSIKDKAIVIGALGYFILPHDLIADIIPLLGFTDDMAVMTIVIRTLSKAMTPELKNDAKEALEKILKEKS